MNWHYFSINLTNGSLYQVWVSISLEVGLYLPFFKDNTWFLTGLYRVVRLKDDKHRFFSNEFHIYPFSYLRLSVHTEMHTDIKEKEIPKEKESISTEDRQLFEDFRLRYSGKKRGLDTELNNFIKKIKDWKKVLPILSTVNLDFDVTEKRYIPHLQTFINQRKWEMMTPGKPKPQPYQEFNWRKK